MTGDWVNPILYAFDIKLLHMRDYHAFIGDLIAQKKAFIDNYFLGGVLRGLSNGFRRSWAAD